MDFGFKVLVVLQSWGHQSLNVSLKMEIILPALQLKDFFFPDFYETTKLKGFVKCEVTQVNGRACVLTTLFDPFSVSYV